MKVQRKRNSLELSVNTTDLASALVQLSASMGIDTKAASKVTAQAIVREAKGRAPRRTGALAEGIHYEESKDGLGYVVLVVRPGRHGVPWWVEHGTQYMTARPFLHVSAALEQPGHYRRVEDAVNVAIDANGFKG